MPKIREGDAPQPEPTHCDIAEAFVAIALIASCALAVLSIAARLGWT